MKKETKIILITFLTLIFLSISVTAAFEPGQAFLSTLKTALNIQQYELAGSSGDEETETDTDTVLEPEIEIGEIQLESNNMPEGVNQIVTIPVTTLNIPNDSQLGVKLVKDGIDVLEEEYTVEGNTVQDNSVTIILKLGETITTGDYLIVLSYEYLIGVDTTDTVQAQSSFTITTIKIKQIIIEQTAISMEKDETTIITYSVEPNLFTDADLQFTSEDENVAILTEGGLITGVGRGQTNVKISSLDGTVYATCPVTVLEPSIEIKEITSTPEQVLQGEEGTFNIKIEALDFQNEKRLDISIYKHDQDVTGLFEIKGNAVQNNEVNLSITPIVDVATSGEYTISVTYDENQIESENLEKQTAIFKIYGATPITAFEVEQDIIRMTADEERQIITTITPENAQNKKLIYKSNNPEVASVDENGLVESIANGTAIITITSDEDPTLEETVEIRVMELIESEEYNVDLDNRIIKYIPENTTKKVLLENIQIGSDNYLIKNKSENIITDEELVGTNSKLTINEQEVFSFVVTGDTNGDGKISVTDLSQLKLHFVELTILENLPLIGADINKDGETTLTDLSIMKEYLVGISI